MALYSKLKALWARLFAPKAKGNYLELGYNLSELQKKIERDAMTLHACRVEDGFRALKRVIESERNVQILYMARLSEPSVAKLSYQQGRISALDGLLAFIEDCENVNVAKALGTKSQAGPKVTQLRRGTSEAIL